MLLEFLGGHLDCIGVLRVRSIAVHVGGSTDIGGVGDNLTWLLGLHIANGVGYIHLRYCLGHSLLLLVVIGYHLLRL